MTVQKLSDDYLAELESCLLHLDDCNLECDGMTLAISYSLKQAGIAHQRMVGHAEWKRGGQVVYPHCWIELDSETVIDFRLRMWLGDFDILPHGVFRLRESGISYSGQVQSRALPTKAVLNVMTDGRLVPISAPPFF
ncbi:hypothetical protein [Eoetvoesiella caeni]